MAALFAAEGYRVERNVIVAGRSGARHEVDVLAARDDGLVTSRVAVECKNREAPADTAVVARLRLMRDDLDVSEVLLVAPGGWTPAAERGAAHAGVRLWGPRELAGRMGRAAVTGLTAPAAAGPAAEGLPRRIGAAEGRRRLRVHAGGVLGMSRDRLEWDSPAWLPVHEVTAVVTVLHGRVRPRPHALRAHLAFDGVAGSALARAATAAPTVPVVLDAPALVEATPPRAMTDAIARALARRDAAVQPATRARHAAALEALLLEPDALDVRVEAVRTYHAPVHLALLRRRAGHERIAVLDAGTGRVDAALSDALTPHGAALAERLAAG